MNNINTILKAIRKFNRMTQEQVSDKLDLSRSYLCEIENGKKKPTLELIYKYSEVFGIKPYLILQFSEGKNALKNKMTKTVVRFLEYIMGQ